MNDITDTEMLDWLTRLDKRGDFGSTRRATGLSHFENHGWHAGYNWGAEGHDGQMPGENLVFYPTAREAIKAAILKSRVQANSQDKV